MYVICIWNTSPTLASIADYAVGTVQSNNGKTALMWFPISQASGYQVSEDIET